MRDTPNKGENIEARRRSGSIVLYGGDLDIKIGVLAETFVTRTVPAQGAESIQAPGAAWCEHGG